MKSLRVFVTSGVLALGFGIFGFGIVSGASAGIVADECKKQFLDSGTETISCDLNYQPSTETVTAVLSAGTAGPELDSLKTMIETTICKASIEAPKTEVTETWFTPAAVAIPELPVVCTMTDQSGSTLEVTTLSKVDCTRPEGKWACQTTIRDTTGLSFMGGVLESMINGNQGLSKNLEKLVTGLSKELGIDA